MIRTFPRTGVTSRGFEVGRARAPAIFVLILLVLGGISVMPGAGEKSAGNAPTGPGEAARMEGIRERISANERAMDPFGLPMTPGKVLPELVVEPPRENAPEKVASAPAGLIFRAVERLPLTGIYRAKNQIVVRGRPYQSGDVILVEVESLVVKLQFVGLETMGARFRDADTGEEAVRPLRTPDSGLPPRPSSTTTGREGGTTPVTPR